METSGFECRNGIDTCSTQSSSTVGNILSTILVEWMRAVVMQKQIWMWRFIKTDGILAFWDYQYSDKGTNPMSFVSNSLPRRKNFRLRPWYKKSSPQFLRTMSFNIGKMSKLKAVPLLNRFNIFPAGIKKSMLFKTLLPLQVSVCPFRSWCKKFCRL